MSEKRLVNNLKTIRKEIGLRQTGLAELAGLTQGAITHIETGRRNPSMVIARRIVKAINQHAEALELDNNYTIDDVFP